MPAVTRLLAIVALAAVAASEASASHSMSLRARRTEAMEYEAVMAGVTPQCFIENGWDYAGYDLHNVPGSVDQCCDKCYNFRGCEVWTWTNQNGGTCWLKEKAGALTRNPSAKSGLLFTGSRPTCEIVQDYDLQGNDVGSARSASADNCCGICQGYAGCRSFSWTDYEGGTCWLKGLYNGELVAKPGVKSGVAFPIQESLAQCGNAVPDTDYYGNDIGSQSNIPNALRCCELCRATDNCRAYTWTWDNSGTCYLKSKMGEKVFKLNAISAQVWPNVEERCNYVRDRDFAGQDMGSAPSASPDQCCSQCRSTGGCKAWSWTDYNGGTCWFKRGSYFSVVKAGAITGELFEEP